MIINLSLVSISLSENAPTVKTKVEIGVNQLNMQSFPPFVVRNFKQPSLMKVVYKLKLTGAENGKDDVILPMSSFQTRARQDKPTFVAAYIPNVNEYHQSIIERNLGEIIIYKCDVMSNSNDELCDEIARADFESLSLDLGSEKSTITISGHKTIEHLGQQTITLEGVQTISDYEGQHRVRCAVSRFLRPGDIAQYEDISFVVGTIVHTVSPELQYMDVTEA